MSTRSEIDFVVKGEYTLKNGKTKKYEEYRRVYRHSDGYPEGVIPDLKEFLAWNGGRNSDVEYATANFLYWSKRRMEEDYWQGKGGKEMKGGKTMPNIDTERKKWSDVGSTGCSVLHIGFGVCDPKEFHGDIEYYYRVIVEDGKPEIKIEVYEVERKDWKTPVTMKSMKLIKTEKITRKPEGGNVISQP